MGFWKRTGWLALGIMPTLAVLFWQVIVSTVSLVVYVVYNSAMSGDSTLTMERYEELVMNFTGSSANNVNMFLIYIGLQLFSAYVFGLALILLIASLGVSFREIQISTRSLEIYLGTMEKGKNQK